MVVHNATTLGIDFLSTNLGGATTDEVLLTKSRPCNFGDHCAMAKSANAPSSPEGDAGRVVSPSRPASTRAAAAVQAKWRGRAALPAGGAVPQEQVDALVALYNATNGSAWNRSTNWLRGDPCSETAPWFGISCAIVTERTLPNLWNSSGLEPRGVTAVQLLANNLVGPIPTGLGPALSSTIQLIDLSANRLSGVLPQSLLLGLPVLHTLFVEPATDDPADKLTGTLPTEMGSAEGLPNLRFLALTRNALTGTVPASLGELSCHVISASGSGHDDPSVHGMVGCLIWLSGNNLTGTVPRALCNRTFNEVYIAGNQLVCPMPCFHVGYTSSSCTEHCTPC